MQRVSSFAFVLLIASIATFPAAAQNLQEVLRALEQSTNQRVVSVSGEGEVQVEPDQATVRFGVVTEAEAAEAAREQNAEASKNAMNAVRELDVPERKIQLETLRLRPLYEYDNQRNDRELVGYEATRIVVVELDDLEVLPVLVARVVERGANRLEGIQYGLQDRAEVRNEALQEAVQNAQDKARVMTEALNVEVGRVVRIDEQSFDMPRPYVRMEMAQTAGRADAAAPEPEAYAAGEMDVRAAVQVTFALQ